MIEYEIVLMHTYGNPKMPEDKPMDTARHTNPAVVMSILNEHQHRDRYVKVIIDGLVAGYQSYRQGKRVTLKDIS